MTISKSASTSIKDKTLLNIIFALIGIITTISLTLAGAALKWSFDANAELKRISTITSQIDLIDLKTKIDTLYENINNDNNNSKQDSSISKHWKLLSWSKDQINELRIKNNLDIVSWPDLDTPTPDNQ